MSEGMQNVGELVRGFGGAVVGDVVAAHLCNLLSIIHHTTALLRSTSLESDPVSKLPIPPQV
jgi:hypothetical protein